MHRHELCSKCRSLVTHVFDFLASVSPHGGYFSYIPVLKSVPLQQRLATALLVCSRKAAYTFLLSAWNPRCCSAGKDCTLFCKTCTNRTPRLALMALVTHRVSMEHVAFPLHSKSLAETARLLCSMLTHFPHTSMNTLHVHGMLASLAVRLATPTSHSTWGSVLTAQRLAHQAALLWQIMEACVPCCRLKPACVMLPVHANTCHVALRSPVHVNACTQQAGLGR
jgi:hypothetical protein